MGSACAKTPFASFSLRGTLSVTPALLPVLIPALTISWTGIDGLGSADRLSS